MKMCDVVIFMCKEDYNFNELASVIHFKTDMMEELKLKIRFAIRTNIEENDEERKYII